MFRREKRTLAAFASFLSVIFISTSFNQEVRAESPYENVISEIMLDLEAHFEHKLERDDRRKREMGYALQSGSTKDEYDDYFPDRPVSRPISGSTSSPYPGFIPSHGSAYLIGIEVLYQTLQFFGVRHHFEKVGNTINFQVIHSEQGYFNDLDSATVAFALREFSRYLVAHLCNDPSMENFYKAFTQVPIEEIGLRFKYLMAWALLGNYLPREPNGVIGVGQKWSTFGQVLSSQKSLGPQESGELRKYVQTITDIVNFLTAFNRTYCFVDIRIKAREEIMNRIVVKRFLNLGREIYSRPEQNREIIEAMNRAAEEDRLRSLKGKS